MLCMLPGSHPGAAMLAQGQQQAKTALGGVSYMDKAPNRGHQAHFEWSWLAPAPGLLHPHMQAQVGLRGKGLLHGAIPPIPRNIGGRWSKSPWRYQSPCTEQAPNP